MKMPDPAHPRWPGVPGSALRTFQMTLLSIWFCCEVHLHVNGGADGEDVGEDVAGDAAVDVAAVEPDCVGVADVADHVAAEEQVVGAVELGSGGFPAALGVGPAAPLDEIVFDERVLGSHAADAFDAAVANGVAADDLRCSGLRRETAIPVAVADVEADAVGPFDGVVFDDPVIAAGSRDQAALRKRVSRCRRAGR